MVGCPDFPDAEKNALEFWILAFIFWYGILENSFEV